MSLFHTKKLTLPEIEEHCPKVLVSTVLAINDEADNAIKNKLEDSPMCSICMENFQPEDKVRKLLCSHIFHAECIDRWLMHSSNTCPADGLCSFPACQAA